MTKSDQSLIGRLKEQKAWCKSRYTPETYAMGREDGIQWAIDEIQAEIAEPASPANDTLIDRTLTVADGVSYWRMPDGSHWGLTPDDAKTINTLLQRCEIPVIDDKELWHKIHDIILIHGVIQRAGGIADRLVKDLKPYLQPPMRESSEDSHKKGAREGWIRACVFYKDMDAEDPNSEYSAEMNKRWPII